MTTRTPRTLIGVLEVAKRARLRQFEARSQATLKAQIAGQYGAGFKP